ncbi:MAG: hypothetical protein H6605_08645 [Flavobacteriales bacterium]|nr:hypothetical protein [Flavobacteriales bacterium]
MEVGYARDSLWQWRRSKGAAAPGGCILGQDRFTDGTRQPLMEALRRGLIDGNRDFT